MATTYRNPGVNVSITNTPVINSSPNNAINVCIMGDFPSSGSRTDTLTFKNSNSYNPLSSNYVGKTSTNRPDITSVTKLSSNTALTLGTDYQASYVNGVSLIAGMPCIKINGGPTGGTFTLTFAINGNTSNTLGVTGISATATAGAVGSAVQSAAQGSTIINDNGITVTGSAGVNTGEIILTVVPSTSVTTQSILTFLSSTNTFTGGTSPSVTSYNPSTSLASQTLLINYNIDTHNAYGNTLNQFNSSSGVIQQFGTSTTTDSLGNSVINSPVSLAAQLAFTNGASQVWILPVKKATPANASAVATDWVNAFTAMQTINGIGVIDTIVPLMDYTMSTFDRTTFATYLSYQQNTNQILQRMFVSQDTTSTLTQSQTLSNDAISFSNQRISLVAPTCIQIQSSLVSSNATISIAGYYAAAAIAGLFSSLPGPQEPLTHKNVLGFTTINPPIPTSSSSTSVSNYQTLQTNGVLCLKQKVDGSIYIRHGLTTNTTNWLTEEISIIASQDALYNNIKNTLENSTVIGSALTQQTADAVVSLVQGALANAVNSNLIQDYQGLQFQQSTTLPTTITVNFQYSPTFPLNYINVVFSINPTAGTISFNNVSNAFNTTTGA